MTSIRSATLCFLLALYFIKQDASADKEDKSEEIEDLEAKLHSVENSSLEASGPLDSHEAMNNREINSRSPESNREKRSYEFLMGLVNNNSKFEVTNVDLQPKSNGKHFKEESANEDLLELMVKIAANPEQWEQVHRLLQEIDADLGTSKNILDKISNSARNSKSISTNSIDNSSKETHFDKKDGVRFNGNAFQEHDRHYSTLSQSRDTKNQSVPLSLIFGESTKGERSKNISADAQVQKMTVILNGENKQKSSKNHIEAAIKSNKWPDFDAEGRVVFKAEPEFGRTSKYQPDINKATSKTFQRNFAYHRVTGHPLYHTNVDKNPKAYIAVSVIAPKPFNSPPQQEDLILENELRQLKPWTHQQNLKNMAAIRSRWIIQSDNIDNKKN